MNGYFIWGGQALFGFPKPSPEVNRTMGMWGFWMPGCMQFLTGAYLLIGLTWFNVFGNVAPLYIAGLAYGIRDPLVAMAHRRYIDSRARLDGDRFSIHQHSGSGRFSACRGHPRDDHLRRFDPHLRGRNSYTFVILVARRTPCGVLSVCHWNLAYVLHVRHDSGFGAGAKAWI
jgi:hypothetical protein